MSNYALGVQDHDMHVVDGKIARVHTSNSIVQLVKTRLSLVQQEWFLDLDSGLPWYTKMTGRAVNLDTIRAYMATEIVNTTGVKTLELLVLDYDREARTLGVQFEFTDIHDNTIKGAI